jgi:hypothetical protein
MNRDPQGLFPPYPVGMRAFGQNDSEYVFVKALKTIPNWA